MGLFGHHKTFFANILDPGGFMGSGTKGFFALNKDVKAENEKRDAAEAAAKYNAPSVRSENDMGNSEDPEKLKRMGRAALITSSERGVFGNVDVSNRKLFG